MPSVYKAAWTVSRKNGRSITVEWMPPGLKPIGSRGVRFTPVRYGEDYRVLIDGSHVPCRKDGYLFVARSEEDRRMGKRGSRSDNVEDLAISADEFYRRMIHNFDKKGSWRPLRLFRHPRYRDYIHVGFDRDPDARMRWMAAQGTVPNPDAADGE